MDSQPLTLTQIAGHWNVSLPYVSKLRREVAKGGKAMPAFNTFAEADTWREINCPPGRRRGSAKAPPAGRSGRKNKLDGERGEGQGAVVDISAFLEIGGDFDTDVVRQAEQLTRVTYGLFTLAASERDPAAIANATRNWSDAAKQAKAVRDGFLDIQERKRNLIPLDRAMHIVGRELQGLRRLLERQGVRLAPEANPADPDRAQRIIDEDVDSIFRLMESLPANIEEELAAIDA